MGWEPILGMFSDIAARYCLKMNEKRYSALDNSTIVKLRMMYHECCLLRQ